MRKLFRIATITGPGVMFLKALRKCICYPKTVLIGFAVILVFSILRLNTLTMLISIPEMLPEGSEERKSFELTQASFPLGEQIVLLFSQRQGRALSNSELCEIKTWLHSYEFSHEHNAVVLSAFKVLKAQNEANDSLFYRSSLANICGQTADDRTLSLAWAKEHPKSLLISSDASVFAAEIQLIRRDFHGPYGQYDFEEVKAIRTSLDNFFSKSSTLAFKMVAPGTFKMHFIESMMQDGHLNLLIIAIILLLMRFLYGTWKSGLMLTGSLVITTLFIVGLMAWTSTPLDILSTSLFVILSLACAEDFIYLSHLQRENSDGHWRTPYRLIMLPSFYTSLTTFVGFFSLTLSDIVSIQRLGYWAGIGCMVEWVVTLFIMPSVVSYFPKLRLWTKPSTRRIELIAINILNRRISPKLLIASIAAMVLSIHSVFNIRSTDAIDKMWSKSHSYNQTMDFAQKYFGWRTPVNVIFPTDLTSEEIESMTGQMSKHASFVTRDDPWTQLDEFVANVVETPAVERLARREAATNQYFNRYFSDRGSWTRVVFYLRDSDLTSILSFKDFVESICGPKKCFVSGDAVAMASFSDKVIRTLIESFGVSLIIVACILLSLFYASGIDNALPILISSFWGPLVLLAFTNTFLGGVNFVTCVFASVLVGLAGDSAIQFIFTSRRRTISEGIYARQGAALTVALTMSIGSLAYLNSAFEQPKTLGLLFCSGYLVLLFGDVVILKALLSLRLFTKSDPSSKVLKDTHASPI